MYVQGMHFTCILLTSNMKPLHEGSYTVLAGLTQGQVQRVKAAEQLSNTSTDSFFGFLLP